MKQKIIISLVLLFILFGFGVSVATINIRNTSAIFKNLIKLHQIEALRHDLVEKILKVQSDLYTVHTPFAHDLGAIVDNVSSLEKAAQNCTFCHHQNEVTAELENVQVLIDDFKNALSFYITASANKKRIERLKNEAALIGNRLLYSTERMSFEASAKIKQKTSDALVEAANARTMLLSCLALSCLAGILVALHLTRSITRPTSALVAATRKIAAGEIGFTLPQQYKAEFGELTSNLNAMSLSLKSAYDDLQKEVAERKQTAEALRQSEERYALAALGANDGLWDWDLKTDALYLSPRWKAMLGYEEQEIGNSPEDWLSRVHDEDRRLLQAKLNAHIEGHNTHFENEHRMLQKDGSWHWMLTRGIAVRDQFGKAYRIAGSQTDITERKLAEEQLLHDAFHDALTDLPNRALLKNRLQQFIQTRKRRKDFLYAVLFLDLDRFKLVNDSLGHQVGDQLLIAVSKRLLGFVRPTDTVARLGGDEFAILLEDINDLADAVHIAERIQKELPHPFDISGQEVFSTASIGIVLGSPQYDRPEQLLRDADLAMYHAKANGKARYEIFDEQMHEKTLTHLRLETDLRKALERNEFHLHYQPILSLKQNRITGFEALLRWQHPRRGLVLPTEFISIAEETGMVKPIGQWALSEACSTLRRWQEQFGKPVPLAVNLNLSSREFNSQLLEGTKRLLMEIPVLPGTLRFEITESTIMGAPESTAFLLQQLKEMGVGLHIDDFGTGFSSLNYLHQVPIDALKIDRSFVNKMSAGRENYEIIKTIVNLAHNLGMQVIAEGVEQDCELEMLRKLGCEYAQGFFISEPLPAEKAEKLIDCTAEECLRRT